MKLPPFVLLVALTFLGGGAGCGHVDHTAEGNPNRVLTGTVSTGVSLPAGAEVVVRLVAPAGASPGPSVSSDLPVARQDTVTADRILGEQVQKLSAPAVENVPFRIEYTGDDALLRRGVNLDARVYFNGRVRFRTINAHVVTFSSAAYPQHLVLQAADR